MPVPADSSALLRPDLAVSMMEYDVAADEAGYVAQKVLAVFESNLAAATFGRIPVEALLSSPEVGRSPRGGYNRGDWTFEDDTFATHEYGWEEPVDATEAKIYGRYFDVELVASERCRGIVLRAAEIRAAAALFNAVTFTAHPVSNEWDDSENATPIDDVAASVVRVWEACGLWPNALIVNRLVFRNLRNSKQILDRIPAYAAGPGYSTVAKEITAAQLANVFDLEKVIVAGSAAEHGQPE